MGDAVGVGVGDWVGLGVSVGSLVSVGVGVSTPVVGDGEGVSAPGVAVAVFVALGVIDGVKVRVGGEYGSQSRWPTKMLSFLRQLACTMALTGVRVRSARE